MAATMKAQVFYEPNRMVYEDTPVPAVGPEDVVVYMGIGSAWQ